MSGLWFVVGMIAGGAIFLYGLACGAKLSVKVMLKLLKLTPEEFTLFKNKLEEGLEPREPATSWEERLQTLKKFKHGAGAE